MRRFHIPLLSLVLVLAAQPLIASTYYVGNCKIGAYGSISAAVANVPAGSTINVCPGTYAEQVTISQALTLQGIFSDDSSQVIIAVPSGGLMTTSSFQLGIVAAQVEVTAAEVNITGITVDGTATNSNCPSNYYGAIFYSSGSSGTVKNVETRYQNCSSFASNFGILAENFSGPSQSVEIEKNNVHDNTGIGILAASNGNLTASIKGNYAAGGYYAIFAAAAGPVSGNNVFGGTTGVFVGSPTSPVTDNTVTGGTYGIDVDWGVVVSGNTIINSSVGILIDTASAGAEVTSNSVLNSGGEGILLNASTGATIEDNTIVQPSTGIGIEFNCNMDTVSGNSIIGAATGTDMVPAAFTGVNKFYGVPAVRTDPTGC